MSEALHQFHFLQPQWLLALLALPLVLWFGSRRDVAERELSRLADPELLPHLLSGSTRQVRWPSCLFALGWALGVLALSGPTWSRVVEPLYSDRAAQVVAISLSQHMQARDMQPSRMERARYKARDLLAANKDGLNALIGYAGQSFVVAPLTSDAHSLDDLLNAMGPDTMPVNGNDAASAIAQGVQLLQNAKVSSGSLVLITDDANADAQSAARKALASGVHVSVMGIGTEQGAPVTQADGSFLRDDQGSMIVARRNDENLRALAQAGGGVYVAMNDSSSDIAALHAELQPATHSSVAQGQAGDTWQDRGPWLLLPLLLVVAVAFRRGWVLLLPLILLPLWSSPAQAIQWQDWWQRPDQQAASALRQGDASKAEQLARDPALRGAAAYRAKDYAAAVQAFAQAKGSDAKYNLGNALAKLGRYPEAIKAYDQALKADPRNENARANRKTVEAAMRKPPQIGSSQQQQKNHGQGSQNKQGGQQGNADQSPGQQQGNDNQGQLRKGNDPLGKQQNNSQQTGQSQQDKNQQNGSSQQQLKNHGQGSQNKQEGQQSNGDQSPRQQQGNDRQSQLRKGNAPSGRQQNNNQQTGQNQQAQNQQSQGQPNQQQNNASTSQASQQGNKQQRQDSQQDSQNQSGQDASAQAPAPASSSEQAQTNKAEQGLQQQMNEALARMGQKADRKPQTHELGIEDSDDPLSKLPNDVRRDLKRVPDDPGALLRQKFELEYRRRMGAQPDVGEQP